MSAMTAMTRDVGDLVVPGCLHLSRKNGLSPKISLENGKKQVY
jgi:hypothetical protein